MPCPTIACVHRRVSPYAQRRATMRHMSSRDMRAARDLRPAVSVRGPRRRVLRGPKLVTQPPALRTPPPPHTHTYSRVLARSSNRLRSRGHIRCQTLAPQASVLHH